jgi:hypothetical protein
MTNAAVDQRVAFGARLEALGRLAAAICYVGISFQVVGSRR